MDHLGTISKRDNHVVGVVRGVLRNDFGENLAIPGKDCRIFVQSCIESCADVLLRFNSHLRHHNDGVHGSDLVDCTLIY